MNGNLIIGVVGLFLAVVAMIRYSRTRRNYYFWLFLFDTVIGASFLSYALIIGE
jgi:hypothetical protein